LWRNERTGETCVIAPENEIAAAEPRGCDGDEDLVAGQGRTGRFGLNDAPGLGASEDCESNVFGIHGLCVDDWIEHES